jgi:hypothetical protein
MQARSLLLTGLVSLSTLLAACGGGSSSTTGAGASSAGGSGGSGGGGGGGAGGGAGGGTGGEAPECPEGPGFGGGEAPINVGAVSAVIVDQAGAPLDNVEAYVCGLDLCSAPTHSDATGAVAISVNQDFLLPAFKFGSGIADARMVYLVGAGTTDVGEMMTANLLTATGATFTPGGDTTSGDVTITLAANAELEFDLTVEEEDQQQFRAVTMDLADPPAVLDLELGLVQLYAVGPFETYFCPAAQVTVPNDAGLAPGSAVEFVLHGVGTGQEFAPYGGWAVVSDGVVSDDGLTIHTDAAGGLPVLSVFGVRPKL